MSTSRAKKLIHPERARAVRFVGDTTHVALDDGRDICVAISSFPRLQAADARKRGYWRLIGGGIGVHWEDIDEDLSVAALFKQAVRGTSPVTRP